MYAWGTGYCYSNLTTLFIRSRFRMGLANFENARISKSLLPPPYFLILLFEPVFSLWNSLHLHFTCSISTAANLNQKEWNFGFWSNFLAYKFRSRDLNVDLQFPEAHPDYQYQLFLSAWHRAARAWVHHERGQLGSEAQSQHRQGLWPPCRVTWSVSSPVTADNGKVITQVHGQALSLVNMSSGAAHSTRTGITPVQLRQEPRAPMLRPRINRHRRWARRWISTIWSSWWGGSWCYFPKLHSPFG